MQNIVVSRLAALIVVTATVFGAVSPALAAPSTPSNLDIVGGKYTNDTTPTLTWTPASGATWYEVLLDDGEWKGIGNVYSYTLSKLPNGWHTFYVRSYDNAGGVSVSSGLTFEIDTQGPNVSLVSPTTAIAGKETTIKVTSGSSDVATMWCEVIISGKAYEMSPKPNQSRDARDFSIQYTFPEAGAYDVKSLCKDGDGNYNSGATRLVSVARAASSVPSVNINRKTVVKTQCSSYATYGDACHTVFYYGIDGKKHAFQTESVYKSWYSSFDNVVIVSKGNLKEMPTGENVTYRPGTSLVKFPTASTVYAVADGQVLRPIVNVAAAKAIYGSMWQKYVVVIPVSYKDEYTIGKKIYSSADYSRSQARHEVQTIDENWAVEQVMAE